MSSNISRWSNPCAMRLGELGLSHLRSYLENDGIDVRTGRFVCRIRSSLPDIAENLLLLYTDFPADAPGGFADFHVRISPAPGIRRWLRPQVYFRFDDRVPFKPLPRGQAFPMLEWGLNWCISNHAHDCLVLHAAVVEKNGGALLLPAHPGAGKSTLCAALVARGWRLLSDELGLVDLRDLGILPLARPINLKNASIDIIKERAEGAVFSPPFHDTNKGTVALMRPPAESVARSLEAAHPAWIVAVEYQHGAITQFASRSKARMFMHVADSAFNYSLLGRVGFDALSGLIDMTDCYALRYSRLEEAIEVIESLEPASRRVQSA
jgi:HprK-related kinase A